MMEYVFVDDLHRYKRLKVTRACESCRRRKVKCDGGSGGTQTPCSSCRKLKIECIFSNMALKRAPPKTEAEQMDERLQRIENLLHKLDEEDTNSGKKELTGRANYIYTEEGKLLKGGEMKSEMLILAEPPLPFTHYPTNTGPTPELANHLIQLYFKHVHPYMPILHKADFLRRLDDKTNPISPLLLYSVFATAAKFSDDPAVRLDIMKPETAGFPYYNRAKDLLDDFLDTPRLSTVQAQILMLKFQEGIRRPGFFFRSWLYFGIIIRMAQDLGLNKNFDKWNLQISREDLIARKRVWQICFLCDQFMSGAQGRDVVISLSNTDIDLPTKEDYEDEEELQIQIDFVHLVRLTKILASVMSVIAPAGSGSPLQAWSSNPKLTTLDAALDAWILALPPRLQCPPTFETSSSLARPPVSHFAGFLNILYHTILILLHRPYIASLDATKVTPPQPNHVNICTVAANSISQTAQSMFETWGPLVFQYPVRGGNYGVYCFVAASMIHLVNMASPDLRYSRPAHDHLMRTLRVLRVCVEHSAAWELRDKVQALEVAFSAQQARQSVVMMFQPGSNPTTSNPNMPHSKARRPQPKRRFTAHNTGINMPNDNGQHILPNSLPATFSNIQHPVVTAPQFQDRPLYLLSEDLTCEPQSFLDPSNQDHATAMGHSFDYMNHGSMDDSAMLGSSLQMDLSGSVDPNSYWDNNNLLVWNQLSNPPPHVWSSSGGISPVSLSTSPSAPPSTGQQTPNHPGSSPSLEQINFVNGNTSSRASSPGSSPQQITPGVIDPVIVASQNHEELIVYSDYQ